MSEATVEQLARISELMGRFARLRERTVVDVIEALLWRPSLRALGFTGNEVTAEQAEEAERILTAWVAKAEAMAEAEGGEDA